MNENNCKKEVEYIQIENTLFKVTEYYKGSVTLDGIIKAGLKRDAEAVLRQMDND